MGKLRAGSLLLSLALVAPFTHAQAPAAPQAATLAYDAVTIKPDKTSDPGNLDIDVSNDLFSAKSVSVKGLLQEAYGINEDLISGVPGPIGSARFDIEAKIVDPDPKALGRLSEKQRGAMLLPVLMERFKLQAHTETRTLPIYELVVTKSGQTFKPAGEHQGSSGTGVHNGALTATDISMADFASFLEDQVHRTVVDKTGLAGKYDFTMKFARANAEVSAADDTPSIFTAVEEQLGLKLEPAKGPVETIVVDHVEMPSEN